MERNHALLRAVLMGGEPIVIGALTGIQRLIFLGLGNIGLILLRCTAQPQQTKSSLSPQLFSYKNRLSDSPTGNSYFGAFAFLALVGGVISYILGGSETRGNIALGVTTAGIVFWLFAGATHGLKHTRKNSIGKVSAGLILLGIGRVVLGTQGAANEQTIFDDIRGLFTNISHVPTAVAPTGEINEQSSGTQEIQTYSSGTDTANGQSSGQDIPENQMQTGQTPSLAGSDNTIPLSFATVIPALVQAFGLEASGPDVSFAHIPKTSTLYKAFKVGYAARFYGLQIHPDALVSCNVYLVMIGLAQKRDVSYNSTTIFDVYATEAGKRGQTYGCETGKNVTMANLPPISESPIAP